MILGTHNSVTYLQPKHWWLWFGKPFAKCQDMNIEQQWNIGVRCFDIRVRFDEKGNPIMAHGVYEVKGSVHFDILAKIEGLMFFEKMSHPKQSKRAYVRVILESRMKGNLEQEEKRFKRFCSKLHQTYPLITFFGGNRKGDWKQIYDFQLKTEIIQAVGSMANEERKRGFNVVKARWYEKFMPKCYARRNNKLNTDLLSDKECIVLFDFI